MQVVLSYMVIEGMNFHCCQYLFVGYWVGHNCHTLCDEKRKSHRCIITF